MKRLIPYVAGAGLAGLVLAAAFVLGQGSEDGPPVPGATLLSVDGLAGVIRAVVVYERPDGIYKSAVGQTESVRLVEEGSYPRWSADGRHVAFVQGNRIMWMTADGSSAEPVATAREPRAVACHPDGREILFTDGNAVKAASLVNGDVRTLVSGHRFLEIDSAPGPGPLVTTVKRILGYQVLAYGPGGGERIIARGCSASLSPDGTLVTSLFDDHRRLALRDTGTGRIQGIVAAPAGLKFDNQFWSNKQDWIASESEGSETDIYVHRVSSGQATRVTFTGDCHRPDLFIKDVL